MLYEFVVRADAVVSLGLTAILTLLGLLGFVQSAGSIIAAGLFAARAASALTYRKHPWVAATGIVVTAVPVLCIVLVMTPYDNINFSPTTGDSRFILAGNFVLCRRLDRGERLEALLLGC